MNANIPVSTRMNSGRSDQVQHSQALGEKHQVVESSPHFSVGVAMWRRLDAMAYSNSLRAHGIHAVPFSLSEIAQVKACSVTLLDRCVRLMPAVAEQLEAWPPTVMLGTGSACTCCYCLDPSSEWETLVMALKRTAGLCQTAELSTKGQGTKAFESLTPRERDVLNLISKGYTVRKCAVELGLAESTVGNHKYRMMRKLGVGSSLELLRLAYEHGVIKV